MGVARTVSASAALLLAILAAAPVTAGEERARPAVHTPGAAGAPSALLARSGIIVFRMDVLLSSHVPAGEKIVCVVSASHAGGQTYSELASVTARRNARKAFCIIAVPYSWPQAITSGSVQYSLHVSDEADDGKPGIRSHSRTWTARGVPEQGTTTTIIQKVRL